MSQSPRSSRPPLLGRRIAVTRAREQADELVRALEALGAAVVAAPMIRIQPLADLAPLRAALARLPSYAWVIFTSQDRKSTRLNSSHGYISYAVFCLKKKKNIKTTLHTY